MSFLVNWFWDLLYGLGVFQKEATILLLGLDNAGKTTLLHKLKSGKIRLFIPTQRAQVEKVTVGNVTFHAWDLGGHETVRNIWQDYYPEADAIVFVVDSADPSRMAEAKKEIFYLLDDEHLAECIFLVLANKSDKRTAMSRLQVIASLGLEDFELGDSPGAQDDIEVFPCSLIDGTGYLDAFRWLSKNL
mmetsp:Transcript_2380/g.2663  ORF Transcript_2380/g.2663 Transcript_2380/m.2663 type:complete len:189 (+) Transcript_2380:25-591(+)